MPFPSPSPAAPVQPADPALHRPSAAESTFSAATTSRSASSSESELVALRSELARAHAALSAVNSEKSELLRAVSLLQQQKRALEWELLEFYHSAAKTSATPTSAATATTSSYAPICTPMSSLPPYTPVTTRSLARQEPRMPISTR